MPPKGRWVFQNLPKWETLPASYYSLRKSEIFLKLWLRKVPAELIDVCLERDVLPPPNLRGRKLLNWIRSLMTQKEGGWVRTTIVQTPRDPAQRLGIEPRPNPTKTDRAKSTVRCQAASREDSR